VKTARKGHPSTGEQVPSAGHTEAEIERHIREQRHTALSALRSVLGRSRDEEDLVQEVLTRLVIRLRQPGDLRVGTWTWQVAHNIAVDHIRTQHSTPVDSILLDRPVDAGLEAEVIAKELTRVIEDGLARIPERQRAALLAQASLDGQRGGHSAVAANLGVTPKAAESILARARRSLRAELAGLGVPNGVWIAVGIAAGALGRLFRRKSVLVGAAIVAVAMVAAPVVMVPLGTGRRSPHTSVQPRTSPAAPARASSASSQDPFATAPAQSSPVEAPRSAPGTTTGPGAPAGASAATPAASISAGLDAPGITVPTVTVPVVTLPPLTVSLPGVAVSVAPGSVTIPSLLGSG